MVPRNRSDARKSRRPSATVQRSGNSDGQTHGESRMSGHSPDEIYQRIRDCFETGLDWETRTLYIIGELEDEKVHRYAALFQILDSTPGPITVTIISNGGFEQVGFALYDIIKQLRTQSQPLATVSST